MTMAPRPALARRCGNGNGVAAMSGSYTSCPRTQRARPFSSIGTFVAVGHVELHGGGLAARADAGHREAVLAGVVHADAAEIHRQLFLEPRDHHLENAAQVLALTDRVRDARQQRQPLQLFARAGFHAPVAR